MKKMILLGLMTFSAFAQAVVVNVKCDMPNTVFQNQFSLQGQVTVDGSEYTDGQFEATFKNNGNTGREFSMDLSNDGSVKVFEAGTLAKNKVLHIESANKVAEVEHMSLLVGYPGSSSSQIRFANGRSYKASCKFLYDM
jgi:hypothetical protein